MKQPIPCIIFSFNRKISDSFNIHSKFDKPYHANSSTINLVYEDFKSTIDLPFLVIGRIELKITDGKQPQINSRNSRKHNILQKNLRIRK